MAVSVCYEVVSSYHTLVKCTDCIDVVIRRYLCGWFDGYDPIYYVAEKFYSYV